MRALTRSTFVLVLSVLLAATAVTAQKSVDGASDLVGRGRSVTERELESRGYEFVQIEETDIDFYSYWVEPGTKDCVSVHTIEGRSAEIVYTAATDCEVETETEPEPTKPAEPARKDSTVPGEEEFDTVCGVVSGSKTDRMKCRLRNENCAGSGQCRTHLTLPDSKLTITWRGGGEIDVKAPGKSSEKSKTSMENGQTKFDFDGDTYFVYRRKDDGKRELAKLK